MLSPFTPLSLLTILLTLARSLSTTQGFTFIPTRSLPTTSPSPSRLFSSMSTKPTQEELKKLVGYKAVDDYVRSDMVIGLGTGSTAFYAVERVGQLLASGALTNILAIPTSIRTKEQAEALNIPLVSLDTHSKLDVAIDGADSVDPALNLVKGGGGALFREKIVEIQSAKLIIIVDQSKMVPALGPAFPVPIEILPFCYQHTMRVLEDLPAMQGAKAILRMGSSSNNKSDGENIAVSDNGCYLVDMHFADPILDPVALATQITNVVGTVEHGLFVGMADVVIIAGEDGISVQEAKK